VKRYNFFRFVPFHKLSVSFHDLANWFSFRFVQFLNFFRSVSFRFRKNNVPIFRFRKNYVSLFRFAWFFLFHRFFCTSKAGLDLSSGSSIFYNFSRNFWAVTWKFLVMFLVTWKFLVCVLNTNITKWSFLSFKFLQTMICVQYLRNWFLHRI
jgi:hypothetical protein